MKVNGSMIKQTVRVGISTTTELSMKETGRTINSMVKVSNPGLMKQSIPVHTLTELNTGWANSSGMTVRATMENSVIMTSVVRASTPGLTRGTIRETGKPTRCTDQASSGGTMDGSTRENLKMIVSTEVVFSLGPMAANMTVNGAMESKMASAFSPALTASHRKESGKKAKSSAGLMKEANALARLSHRMTRFVCHNLRLKALFLRNNERYTELQERAIMNYLLLKQSTN